MTDGIKLDNQPDTYALPALLNAVYFAFADPSVLAALAVPVLSVLGSGLIAPIVKEWARQWIQLRYDRKRKAEGLPIRDEND